MRYIIFNNLNNINIQNIQIKTNDKFTNIYYRINNTMNIKGIPFIVNICDFHGDYYKYYLKLSGSINDYKKLFEINEIFSKFKNYKSFISIINKSVYINIDKNQHIINIFSKMKQNRKMNITLNLMGIKLLYSKPLIHIV